MNDDFVWLGVDGQLAWIVRDRNAREERRAGQRNQAPDASIECVRHDAVTRRIRTRGTRGAGDDEPAYGRRRRGKVLHRRRNELHRSPDRQPGGRVHQKKPAAAVHRHVGKARQERHRAHADAGKHVAHDDFRHPVGTHGAESGGMIAGDIETRAGRIESQAHVLAEMGWNREIADDVDAPAFVAHATGTDRLVVENRVDVGLIRMNRESLELPAERGLR
jgi:hypothetical protein